MDFEQFSPLFIILGEYFNAQPSSGLTRIYFNAFKDWAFEDFKEACQNVMNARQYNGLPKIDEIREAFYGKAADSASIAWQSLMNALRDHAYWDSVIFKDGAIGRAIEAMGGWIAVSGWTIEEWRMRRKEFEAIYLVNLKLGNNSPIKMTGMIEMINGERFKEFNQKSITIKSQNQIMKKPKLISMNQS